MRQGKEGRDKEREGGSKEGKKSQTFYERSIRQENTPHTIHRARGELETPNVEECIGCNHKAPSPSLHSSLLSAQEEDYDSEEAKAERVL